VELTLYVHTQPRLKNFAGTNTLAYFDNKGRKERKREIETQKQGENDKNKDASFTLYFLQWPLP
jgi:hypothetical protein